MPDTGGVSPSITANDLLKQRSRTWLSRSLVLAVIIHVAVLTLAPEMSVAEDAAGSAPELIVVPPPVRLPEPPEPIASPAAPILGSIDVAPQVTIESTRWDAYQPEQLAAPRPMQNETRATFERFTSAMIAPSLKNPAEVERALVRNYPPVLRDAGIGGKVDVHLWLDENGRVVRSEVARGSGYDALDAAALEVVDVMELTPALNRGAPVRVIVTLPVIFNVRN